MKKLLCAITLSIAALTAAAAPVNLVTNGDFSAGGSNWTVTGNMGYLSFPGYWNDGAVGSDAYLSQVIATVAGQQYKVSFDTSINWGSMAASLDGTQFFSTNASGHYDASVVAVSDNAMLTFITHNDPSYNQLDNVIVNAVPEPASLGLFGLGIAALCAMRRKKGVGI